MNYTENGNIAFNYCNSNHNTAGAPQNDEADILVRKYGETIYNTISSVASVALEFPKGICISSFLQNVYAQIFCFSFFFFLSTEIIKDTARPSYWVPDAESPNCSICGILFGTAEKLEIAKSKGQLILPANSNNSTATTSSNRHSSYISGDCKRHHCRSCGQAVCGACSKTRRPVPERGWPTDVRVCDACACLENKSKKED